MLRLSDTLAYKKSDQNPISSYKICTLSSKRVMRIKMPINMGYDKESSMLLQIHVQHKNSYTKLSVIYIKQFLFAFFLSGFLNDQTIEGR